MGFVANPSWEASLLKDMMPALHSLKNAMLQGAIEDCPKDTGNLVNHMWGEVLDNGSIVIGNDAAYAMDVEKGHFIPAGDIPDKTARDPMGFVEAVPFLRWQAHRRWNIDNLASAPGEWKGVMDVGPEDGRKFTGRLHAKRYGPSSETYGTSAAQ